MEQKMLSQSFIQLNPPLNIPDTETVIPEHPSLSFPNVPRLKRTRTRFIGNPCHPFHGQNRTVIFAKFKINHKVTKEREMPACAPACRASLGAGSSTHTRIEQGVNERWNVLKRGGEKRIFSYSPLSPFLLNFFVSWRLCCKKNNHLTILKGGKKMQSNKLKQLLFICFMGLFLLFPFSALAGSLDSPAAPTAAGSAMYTLSDIYNRLTAGTTGTKRSGAFAEPSAGPTSGTGRTLDEVMGKAPTADNTNGVLPAEVANSKTYWGLRTDGTWGPQTGTLAIKILIRSQLTQ